MELSVGSTIGDYRIIDILGAGGMGKVYKVRNTISDRVEAMKVLLPDLGGAPELADRFLREIKVQASLEHPNIAALHTALRVDNQLLMLMELVEGETLEQKLKAGPIPVALSVDYIRQVLSALEYAHARGVVHRDIKPANMMLTPSGVVKLMDFGIAKATGDHKLTMTGTTMGSLYYMSPEQIKGATTLDARADLYSVGVSLYELATGKRPFDGDSQFAIMSAHLEKVPVPPVTLDPSMPRALNDVILMAVMKDPSARFQTATAFRNALGTVGATGGVPAGLGATVPASPPPVPLPVAIPPAPYMAAPAQPPVRRSHRGIWMALGGLAAAAAVVAAIQFGPWHATKAAPQNMSQQQVATPQSVAPSGIDSSSAANPSPAQPPQTTPPAVPQAVPPPGAAPSTPGQDRPSVTGTAPRRVPDSMRPIPVRQLPAEDTDRPPRNTPNEFREKEPARQLDAGQHREVRDQPAPVDERALREQREFHQMLAARASAVRASLRTLEGSQRANGMNLRGDIRESQSLMDAYLESVTEELNRSDLPAARNDMEKAEREIEKLEKFLGR